VVHIFIFFFYYPASFTGRKILANIILRIEKIKIFIYMLNLLNLNLLSNCDTPRPWGLYFQDSATPQMEGLVELHEI
jgi:hypothetical protein